MRRWKYFTLWIVLPFKVYYTRKKTQLIQKADQALLALQVRGLESSLKWITTRMGLYFTQTVPINNKSNLLSSCCHYTAQELVPMSMWEDRVETDSK